MSTPKPLDYREPAAYDDSRARRKLPGLRLWVALILYVTSMMLPATLDRNAEKATRADNGFNTGFSGWVNGDADGNGFVDGDDYALIDNAFSTQGAVL
jgi:hypothetical protein